MYGSARFSLLSDCLGAVFGGFTAGACFDGADASASFCVSSLDTLRFRFRVVDGLSLRLDASILRIYYLRAAGSSCHVGVKSLCCIGGCHNASTRFRAAGRIVPEAFISASRNRTLEGCAEQGESKCRP